MNKPITVTVQVDKLSTYAYEIRAVMKGKFYRRIYLGYSKKTALALFQDWLGEQL